MTIQQQIESLQNLIREQLQAHEQFFDSWNNADWHLRAISLQSLLHGMWRVYDMADDCMSLLSQSFPPYPFTEIREIKRWLKDSQRHIDDFIREEYDGQIGKDYMISYDKFLNKLCGNPAMEKWHSSEMISIDGESELLDMLNKSYSLLLDLLLRGVDQINKPEFILLSYENSKTRYTQLQWPKEQKIFEGYIANSFPWSEEPLESQLQQQYQDLYKEFCATECGRIKQLSESEEDFVMALAKSKVSEKDLSNFFLYEHKLEYLDNRIHKAHFKEQEALKQASENIGRKKCSLFIKGDLTDSQYQELINYYRDQFVGYLKAHKLSSKHLTCTRDTLNEAVVAFCRNWQDNSLVDEKPSGYAIFRFLTEDCMLDNDVQEMSYANKIVIFMDENDFAHSLTREIKEEYKFNFTPT